MSSRCGCLWFSEGINMDTKHVPYMLNGYENWWAVLLLYRVFIILQMKCCANVTNINSVLGVHLRESTFYICIKIVTLHLRSPFKNQSGAKQWTNTKCSKTFQCYHSAISTCNRENTIFIVLRLILSWHIRLKPPPELIWDKTW